MAAPMTYLSRIVCSVNWLQTADSSDGLEVQPMARLESKKLRAGSGKAEQEVVAVQQEKFGQRNDSDNGNYANCDTHRQTLQPRRTRYTWLWTVELVLQVACTPKRTRAVASYVSVPELFILMQDPLNPDRLCTGGNR
ncbi:hypothetical protein GX50_03642 [[Emmonsia] crescens]|uniref:Uncharacterized protein n=1 Tax=[Emmonsia] crescens TaxID=73230 RepID=A0A2B7ZJR9_9EURO|nr:hypothetical protein GX50_03642 [Emmonsia crescens]